MLTTLLITNFLLPFVRALTSEDFHDINYAVDEGLTVTKNPLSAPPDFLFFDEEADIERISFAMNRSIYVLQVSEGTVLERNNGSHIVLRAKNGESLVVDIENCRIDEVSPSGNMNNITLSTGGTNLHTVLNGTVQVAPGEELPIKLTRKAPNNRIIAIEAKEGSAVFERRHSDEIKVLLRQQNKSKNTAEADAVWEDLLIRPQTLKFSAVNSHGTLFFEDQKVLQVNSTRDGTISGSPYANKFGRISKENVSIELIFDDDYGTAKRIDEIGNEIVWNLKSRVGSVKNANSALTLTCERVVEGEHGKIRIYLENGTVDMSNAVKIVNEQNSDICWRKWTTSTATVTRLQSCQDKSKWNVSTSAGTFTYESAIDAYSFVSPAGDKATLFALWNMFNFVGSKLYAAGGKNYMMLYANGIRESGGVEMKDHYFKVHGAPASVVIYKDRAEVETQSSKIVITPYTF